MSAKGYTVDREWSGYTIRPSAKGWICSQWSRVQGTTTDQVVLLPYSKRYPAGLDLSREINEYGTTVAEAIRDEISRSDDAPVRIIRRGHTVQ